MLERIDHNVELTRDCVKDADVGLRQVWPLAFGFGRFLGCFICLFVSRSLGPDDRASTPEKKMPEPLVEVHPAQLSSFNRYGRTSIAQLVGLLKDKNPVVGQLVLENLLPYTQTGNPHISVWEANKWEGGSILKVLVWDNNVPPPERLKGPCWSRGA
jgi:hypothetical protein